MSVICRVTSWSNLVQWQPPDGSRLESDIEAGTDVNYVISYLLTRVKKDATKLLLVYKLFLQRT